MEMKTLFIIDSNTALSKNGERIILRSNSNKAVSIPIRQVEKVVLYEKAMVSKDIIYQIIRHEVPMIFLDWKRDCLSILQNPSKDVDLLIRQVECHKDSSFRLNIAKSIVRSKIKNMRALLRRIGRNSEEFQVEEAISKISRAEDKLNQSESIDEIFGIEGVAASFYFSIYGKSFKDNNFKFERRSKRPAKDPTNALLNFGYHLLLSEICVHVAASGLNSGIGFLHSIKSSRPSLALDVLEIFRQPLIDRLVLKLVNKRILSLEDFEEKSDWGWGLTKKGMKLFLEHYENMMTSRIWLQNQENEATTPRLLIQKEISSLRRIIIFKNLWKPELIKL